MPGRVGFMLDKAVEDIGFFSRREFFSWSSLHMVCAGESVSGGGLAAREVLGGLLDSEKELSLLPL